jgi:hypothetical protein
MTALRAAGLTLLVLAALLVPPARAAGAEELLLGFYASTDQGSLDAAAGTPIDHLIPYGIEGLPEARIKAFLDGAASRKLTIIFSLKDAFKESKWYPTIDWCPTQDEAALVACITKKFAGHEAVGGWYLADEPTNLLGRFKGGKLRANAAMIRANSAKPIFAEEVALPRGKHWDILDEIADMLLVTAYPVPDRPLADAFERVAALRARQRKPVVAVLQAFDKNNVPFFKAKGVAGRPPLAEEERVMSYLALLAGAQGIVYYSVPQLKKMAGWQAHLGRLAELAAELKANYPLIRSAARPLGAYVVTADEGVYHAIRTSGGTDRIIAVNAAAGAKSLRIQWAGPGDRPIVKTLPLAGFDVQFAPIGDAR